MPTRRVPPAAVFAVFVTSLFFASWLGLRSLPSVAVSRSPALIVKKLIAVLQNRRIYFLAKRAFDVVIAGVLLVIFTPVLLVISLLVRLDSPGSAIFAQERIGTRVKYKAGQKYWELRPFILYKFRTMRQEADSGLHQSFVKALIMGDDVGMSTLQNGSKPKAKYKLNNDPRTTRVGKWLRKTSLDELPQLWNVIKGDMSLVGPRPPLAYEVEMYSAAHMRRLEAQPGLTGLWQVSARSEVDFDKMVALDVKYIDSQSFGMDLFILLRTPVAVLTTKGAS